MPRRGFPLPRNEPEGIRTPDPRLRRPLLYPAELQTQNTSLIQQALPLDDGLHFITGRIKKQVLFTHILFFIDIFCMIHLFN